jgi:predicted metal-dependent HD superfamily phosphohydrolase
MNHATSQRFKEVCGRVGIPEDKSLEIDEYLFNCYSELHRSYHNLSHIDRMLSWLDAAGGGPDSVELAIWFHDIIYDPSDRHNEEKSAQCFNDRVGSFIRRDLTSDVERLIMATDPTRPRSGRNDEDLMIDIDLSILGSSPSDYESYRSAIRSEYSFVPEADFRAGRMSILRSFLSQRIYVTEFFAALEQKARSNIRNEILGLELEES